MKAGKCPGFLGPLQYAVGPEPNRRAKECLRNTDPGLGSVSMAGRRGLLLILGWLNVALGVLGIILPLLPTTPFLLLAAYLFARSSERCHRWLLSQPHFGPYIHAFRNKTGLTRSQKARMGASFTLLLAVSVYFAPLNEVRAGLIVLWFAWMTFLYRTKSAVASRAASNTRRPAPVEDARVFG